MGGKELGLLQASVGMTVLAYKGFGGAPTWLAGVIAILGFVVFGIAQVLRRRK